ncbi:MAG: hypothetical protein QOE65_356 [Solirubrobacteraceae bacterium]|jgi:hypothetical protein|nr:hypothetical protein [Solirubrobacteraceae bacterium]
MRPLLLAAAAALAAAVPAGAATQPAFRDRVFAGSAPHKLQSAGPETGYRTQDGQVVYVRVSFAVSNGPAVAQQIVNFLGTRLHGLELGRLRVLIGTPAEIQAACGGDERVLACYAAGERRMYIPDRDPSAGSRVGFTRDYAVTHEYGHHIANYRANTPWPALDWGAKYWSSYKFVCAGVDAGRYYPGNQGEHYLDDPGEGFADAYAHLHYPDVPWQFNDGLRPDAGAFAAIRRDVLSPWSKPALRTLRGTLSGAHTASATSFTTTLDGSVDVRLAGPRGANYDVGVYEGTRLIDRTRAPGSRDRLRLTLCRDSSPSVGVRVRVLRRSGSGRFTLTARFPG